MGNSGTVNDYHDFDPREYLRQYYSLPRLAADDAALFGRLAGWLYRLGRTFAAALDFGCGPTLHNSFALAPHALRIELADYLPANLDEVRRWLDGHPEAHDWDPLLRGVLECEGYDPGRLGERKALYRSRVASLLPCDLRAAEPLGRPAGYDLVTSFFCAECVAVDHAAGEAMMGRLCGLVRPGGAAFFAAVRVARRYRVLGRWFPATPVAESDFLALLPRLGFPADRIFAEAVAAPDWADDGFDHIVLVGATRGAA